MQKTLDYLKAAQAQIDFLRWLEEGRKSYNGGWWNEAGTLLNSIKNVREYLKNGITHQELGSSQEEIKRWLAMGLRAYVDYHRLNPRTEVGEIRNPQDVLQLIRAHHMYAVADCIEEGEIEEMWGQVVTQS